MGWEWFPETPEEIAEHQRMRRELMKCQQMQDDKVIDSNDAFNKKNKKPRSILVLLLVIFTTVYFLSKIDFPFFSKDNVTTSSQGSVQSSFLFNNIDKDVDVHYGKSVSKNTSDYIQQTKEINLALENLYETIRAKLSNGSVIDCSSCVDEFDSLLKNIEQLQNMTVFSNAFSDYQKDCQLYYGRIYTFFNLVKTQQKVSVEEYNQFVLELSTLQKPHETLLKFFDENGYFYYIDKENNVHYKYKNSFF